MLCIEFDTVKDQWFIIQNFKKSYKHIQISSYKRVESRTCDQTSFIICATVMLPKSYIKCATDEFQISYIICVIEKLQISNKQVTNKLQISIKHVMNKLQTCL